MLSQSSKIKYVYLLSAPHSGSTLMAVVLGCHNAITTVGEFGTDFPPQGLCSCGVSYNKCPLWTKILSIYREKYGEDLIPGNLNINLGLKENSSFFYGLYYHLFAYRFIDCFRDFIFGLFSKLPAASQMAIERSLRLIEIFLSEEKTSVFLDTTKNPFQVRFLAQHPDVDLKVIALVRDGRAVTWSLMNKEKWTLERSVKTWLWANRNIQRVCQNYMLPKNIFHLRLEDFCMDPGKYLKDLLNFIGVKPQIEIKGIRESGLHIIGNRMRLRFDGRIRKPDNSWKDNLTSEQLAYFKKKAGWLNKKLGYD